MTGMVNLHNHQWIIIIIIILVTCPPTASADKNKNNSKVEEDIGNDLIWKSFGITKPTFSSQPLYAAQIKAVPSTHPPLLPLPMQLYRAQIIMCIPSIVIIIIIRQPAIPTGCINPNNKENCD